MLALSDLSPKDVTEARQVFELALIPVVCGRVDEHDTIGLMADVLQVPLLSSLQRAKGHRAGDGRSRCPRASAGRRCHPGARRRAA
jgi:hypothetical protein